MRAKIDAILNSWVSKKLTVFVVATILALSNKLTSEDWVDISVVYLGTQGVVDVVKQIRDSRS